MSRPEWYAACDALAADILAACRAILPDAELRMDDRTYTMWAEELYPGVPHRPIGIIYRFRLRAARERRPFGIRWLAFRTWDELLSFGMEEAFGASAWTRAQGVWCAALDARVAEPARKLAGAFATAHGLKFLFKDRSA